jgi:hypothetical protein
MRVWHQRVASATNSPANSKAIPPGDINGEWTHDLHERNSAPSTPAGGARRQGGSSLASRITAPGAQRQQQRRAAQIAQALIRTELAPATKPAVDQRGITIRGLAGPYVVMAQNFAPGTTAADIESAVTPAASGVVRRCRLLKTSPIVVAEIVLETREAADSVVSTFNNQTVSHLTPFP